jgi:putative selenium metabolism hydrolase
MINQDLIQFTQDSIRIPSLTGQEQQFIVRVCHEMNKLGYDRVWVDEAGNAIGEIRGTQSGKRILLDAHADTVSVNVDDWDYDPFGGVISHDRLYGRGTADTKGNLAAMIYAAAKADRSKIRGSIFVSASVHEEVFEGGSLKLIVEQTKPDYVVIGEATDYNLNRGGRGRAEVIVETIGQSAHSSSPEIGDCAVHAMIQLIQIIESQPTVNHPVLGPGSMVLTDILSSPYPGYSVIPNRCRVTFDRRLLVGETIDGLENELARLAEKARIKCKINILDADETTYSGYKLAGKKFFPAWLMADDELFVQESLRALQKIKADTRLSAYRFCTNAAYCAGIAGIPTIGYGLGKETDAHTVNESISINDLNMAAQGFQAIIERVLG